MTLTASPPRLVSLYFVIMSRPVSRMVLITLSRLTWCVPSPRSAMRAAEAESTPECPVKMVLVAPPLYVLPTQTLDKVKGVEVLTRACDAASASIVSGPMPSSPRHRFPTPITSGLMASSRGDRR